MERAGARTVRAGVAVRAMGGALGRPAQKLNVGALGNDGNRIEGHAVGIVQHVAGDLLQPLAQAIVAIADLLLQFVQAGCCRHLFPQYSHMILNAKPRLLNVGHPTGSKNETETSVISSPEIP